MPMRTKISCWASLRERWARVAIAREPVVETSGSEDGGVTVPSSAVLERWVEDREEVEKICFRCRPQGKRDRI